MPYALREAVAAFRRAPLLLILSVVAIGCSIFVIGLFGLATYNVRRAITTLEERVEVVAYLRDDISPAQLQLAEQELRVLPEVRDVRYVSKLEALATARREMEEFQDVFSDLEANPLPASLELRLQPGFRDPASADRVADHLRVYPFVEEVQWGDEWLEKIVFLRRLAAGATAIIGGAFAATAAIIIATAVRIAVFARREEISIMRLVGATNGFVQRPFLLEGMFVGLLGGTVAAGLTYAAYRFVDASLIRLAWLPAEWVLAAILAGSAFGLLSSGLAVRRHLRNV